MVAAWCGESLYRPPPTALTAEPHAALNLHNWNQGPSAHTERFRPSLGGTHRLARI
jgi:hypothetical protein